LQLLGLDKQISIKCKSLLQFGLDKQTSTKVQNFNIYFLIQHQYQAGGILISHMQQYLTVSGKPKTKKMTAIQNE
jgi:hypothetical protein